MKIFPAYHALAADDESFMAVYRQLAEQDRRVILSFEDTKPPETPTVTEYFDQLDRVLTEFPTLKVQINHAGAGDPSDPASDPLNPEAEAIFRVVWAEHHWTFWRRASPPSGLWSESRSRSIAAPAATPRARARHAEGRLSGRPSP